MNWLVVTHQVNDAEGPGSGVRISETVEGGGFPARGVPANSTTAVLGVLVVAC